MTSPLDEKGLRAAMEAQVGQGCAVREYLDFTAEDAKSFGVNIEGENFAKLDVVRHQQYENAGLAILSAAIRAYLSATALPDELPVWGYHVRRLTDEGVAFSQSLRFDPERASATVVVTPLVSGPEAQSALAAMRVERDEAKADAYRSSLETIALQGEINKTNERANKNWRDFRDPRLAIIGDGPMCRDCADENGRCPHSGRPCDPDEAVKEQLASWRAAEAQVQPLTEENEALRGALREAKDALIAAEERDNHARFRANSPREDAEVVRLRTTAIRATRAILTQENADG